MKRTEKKRKQKKAVLICTLATAAVIVGGMTFAWYTSKDEVTNRFSASANFGASIVEEFAPPTDWQPGTETKKVVSVVNTGTVDAFVRTWLTGEMRVVAVDKAGSEITVASTLGAKADPRSSATTNVDKMGLIETATNSATYLKILDNTSNLNPTGTGDAELNEVQSIQAGGYLAYAPQGSAWTYTSKEGNVISGSVAADGNAYEGWEIDAKTFKPSITGLYLFRRNMDINTDDTDKNVEYAGYYYVHDATNPTYYALNTLNGVNDTDTATSDLTVISKSDGSLLTATDISGVKLFTAKSTIYSDAAGAATKLTWAETTDADKDTAATPAWDYSGDNYLAVSAGNSRVKAYIELENLGAAAEQWTKKGTAGASTFYYNNDLESGYTTTNFVKSVTLNPTLNQDDFLTFDFDLNVHMDSVQVTTDTDGKELATAVADWTAPATGFTKATTAQTNGVLTADGSYAASGDTDEIAKITWAD